MSEQGLAYQAAQKRVREMRGFYVHLAVYVLVNALLFTINMLGSPETLWFIFPLGGWGIAVAIHALRTFARRRFLGPEWQARKMDELLNNE